MTRDFCSDNTKVHASYGKLPEGKAFSETSPALLEAQSGGTTERKEVVKLFIGLAACMLFSLAVGVVTLLINIHN